MKKFFKKYLSLLLAFALFFTGLSISGKNDKTYAATNSTEQSIKVHLKWSGGTPSIYYWNVNNSNNNPVSWPGAVMQSEKDNWYTYTIEDASSSNLIFNDKSKNWQTVDLSRSSGEWWFMDGNWFSSNPEPDTNNEITESLTVHYKSSWGKTNIYYWNQNGIENNNPVSWPGKEMTSESNNWYSYTLSNTKSANLIFNNGNSSQTKDLSRISGEWWYSNDTWYSSNPDDQTGGEVTKGNIIIHFNNNWGGANIHCSNSVPTGLETQWPGVPMKSEGDNWYSYTISNVNEIKLSFNYNDNKTDELTRKIGEWWYKDGIWYSSKPEESGGGDVEFNRTDFRDESIYFIMTTRFYDGDSSNNVHCWDDKQAGNGDDDPAWRGDFKGLIEKLDYIKALGFTAIWITPVVENTSGYDYHGYHASNFSKVDSRYESTDTSYQDLIDAVHEKGMKIIQDVVFNHTGNFGEENLKPMFNKTGDLSTSDGLTPKENSGLPANYATLTPAQQYQARLALMKNTDGVNHDSDNIYHHYGNFNWDEYDSQLAQIAGDCVDLNTENPQVYNYLIDSYNKYINMGVDGFRVDTAKHISRLTFNEVFNNAFKKTGGDNFYMFGEVCTRDRNVWYRNTPGLSTPFYTWKDSKDYDWSSTDQAKNVALTEVNFNDNRDISTQPTSTNGFLKGNDYHAPDYSMKSGLDVIDFPMHWNFTNARDAFRVAVDGDKYYNDPTWNVTYVDSHDYAPDCAPEGTRFNQPEDTWAENLNLMFTFRGIPCIYYGSEIEFQKGEVIDKGPNIPLAKTGRAYFGDKIEGSIDVTDFGEYTNASGKIADTLNHPLSLHIQRLNKIRAAIPALRKGQYSTEGVTGDLSFKRRYTNKNEGVDSFVCVSVTDGATFKGVPNGRYVDAITGNVKNITNGTLTVESSGKGNMRVYVLDTELTKAPGKIGVSGTYLK